MTSSVVSPNLQHLSDEPTVAELMARMAAGDRAAVFELAAHHGHRVAPAVRRELARCGVERVGQDDLDGLVLDACMALFDVAPAWNPGGAQPWWWARGRILEVVSTFVGVHADSLDASPAGGERLEPSGAPPASTIDESVAATFARLVHEVPIVGLMAEACAVARIEEASMFCLLEYRIQKDQGDPSPAHTLASRYGITPDALRQRVSRQTRRLRVVVADQARFAPLCGFVLVA